MCEIFEITGMVERCHKTPQDVIKKVMESQQDWHSLLNSVLFTMHSHIHSSTGYSPIKMFKKDPILPFGMADKQNNGQGFTEISSANDNHNDTIMTDNNGNVVNNVFNMVEEIEKHKKEIFACAST